VVCVSGCEILTNTTCRVDADCTIFVANSFCDPQTLVCLVSPPDAATDINPPDQSDSAPPTCASSKDDCTVASAPICGANHMCRACQGGDECLMRAATTPVCDNGACSGCRSNADCKDPNHPICDSDGSCRACVAHTECAASLVCDIANGDCISPNDVVYVDRDKCPLSGATGSQSAPYCDIATALGALSGKSIVRVAGSVTAYSAVSINGLTVSLIGPGRDATPSAAIKGFANHGVSITGNGTVVVDGFEITAATGMADGVNCSNNNASLTLVRDNIHDNNRYGVNSSSCNTTLDEDLISMNTGGAVSITLAQYSITNSMIVKNPSALGYAITFNSGSSGSFLHNTVVLNGSAGTPGAITCNAVGSTAIQNSIVWMNIKGGASNSQINGNCVLSYVDIDETIAGTGNRSIAPAFVGPNDFHLQANATANNSCCIDQIASSPVMHDYDGTTRPQHPKWDIGAHEVK
jgi:hypothetical protein